MAGTPRNWKTLGNLLFYPGFDKRFFYFASLLNGYTKHNDIYNPEAHAIGDAAKNALSNNLGANVNNSSLPWDEKYKAIITFLTKAIETEQQNEKAYLKGKIDLMKKQFSKQEISESPELNQIEAIYQNAINGGNFDYNQFIIALNALMQGLNNTKALFDYEYQRLDAMQKGLQQIYAKRAAQIRGLAVKEGRDITESEAMIEQSITRLDQKRKITYVADSPKISTLRGFKTNIEDTGVTSDVAIARWIDEVVDKIFKSTRFLNLAKKVIQDCNFDKAQAAHILRPIMIKSVTSYAIKHMDEILNKQIYNKSIENIIDDLQNEIQFNAQINIRGYDDKFGEKGEHLDYFKDGLDGILEGKRHATGIYGAITTLYEKTRQTANKPLQKDAINILNLLKNKNPTLLNSVDQLNQFEAQIKNIKKLIDEEIKLTKKNETIANKILDTTQAINLSSNETNIQINIRIKEDGSIEFEGNQDREQFSSFFGIDAAGINLQTSKIGSAITYTKGFLSPRLKKELDAEFEKGYRSTKQKLYDTLYYTLQDLDLRINGPIFSETKLLIQNALISQTNSELVWSGKGGIKTDAFEVFTPGITIGQLKKFNLSKRDPKLKTLVKEINIKMREQQKELLQQFTTDLEDMTDIRTEKNKKLYNQYKKYTSNYLKALNDYTEQDKMIQTLIQRTLRQVQAQTGILAKNQLLADILAERKAEFLNSLKNTLFISSTMKTYNEYQNDIGFIGGSLGTNVISQLDKLSDLFLASGMKLTTDEYDWLLFAIINCSPISVVGERNKNIIENYLGAIAIFALFDEAGAELLMLRAQLDANIKAPSSNILHIYGLNGIYYPGSFVLTQVLESVQSMQSIMNIDSIESDIHNGISIVNGANYKMIPNRNGNRNTKKPSNTDPWGTVSKKVIDSTHLKITFMAGLLGILKNLNSLMQEIPMP